MHIHMHMHMHTRIQDAVERSKGIGKLVALLKTADEEVSAEAAAALAVLADGNAKNQKEVAAVGGVEPLVVMLTERQGER